MPFVLTNDGVNDFASMMLSALQGVYRCGLFRNDVDPGHGSSLAQLGVANFSGYDGERLVSQWIGPTWDGTRATITGPQIVWTRGVGGISGRVFGYYLVNLAGLLVGGQRLEEPVWLVTPGQPVRVNPRLSWRSEF